MHSVLVATVFADQAIVLAPCVLAMLNGVEFSEDRPLGDVADPMISGQAPSASLLNDL